MEIPIKLPSHCQMLLFIPCSPVGCLIRIIGRDCYTDFNISKRKLGPVNYITPGILSVQYLTKKQCSNLVDDNKLNSFYQYGGILVNRKYKKTIQLLNWNFDYTTTVYNLSETFDRLFYINDKFYATNNNIPYLHTFDVINKEYFCIRFECGFITYMDENHILTNKSSTIYCYNFNDLCLRWSKSNNKNVFMSSCCYNNNILYIKDMSNIYKINASTGQWLEAMNINILHCYDIYIHPNFIFMIDEHLQVIRFIETK
jgi:hypothetical protein